jgi:hypothetical protein
VYVLQLERIERRVLAERQVVMQAMTVGADVELPSLQDAWDDFDERLREPGRPAVAVDPVREDILRALGMR